MGQKADGIYHAILLPYHRGKIRSRGLALTHKVIALHARSQINQQALGAVAGKLALGIGSNTFNNKAAY